MNTTAVAACLTGLMTLSLVQTASALPPPPKGQAVKYELIKQGTYNSFVKNWNDKAAPTFAVLIQSPVQYQKTFGAAFVMSGKNVFGPDASMYKTHQLLVVSKLLPTSKADTMKVERLVANGKELSLYYQVADFKKPGLDDSISKATLMLKIPKQSYSKVTVFEAGKKVVELNTAKGQWSKP